VAGYSGTAVARKLGIRAGCRVSLTDAPPEVRELLKGALADCEEVSLDSAPVDLAMVFAKTQRSLERGLGRAHKALAPAGALWLSWPKKSSGVASEIDEHTVRADGLRAGLVDVKVCAVTEVWSGLKFVRRLSDRAPGA
jgi:hypothetical protein